MKFVPVTVSVKAAPPATKLLGDSELRVGVGFGALIVNVCALDVPPPGGVTPPDVPAPGRGVAPATAAPPVAARSLAAAIAACSFVLLTNVVVRIPPFHRPIDDAL